MTRVVLIHAGPTPWDQEDRLVGSHSLPLHQQASAELKSLVDSMAEPITAVHVDKTNEAAITVGKWLATRFKLRTRHSAELAEMNLGLWQGLDRGTLRTRFESSFPQWEQNPLNVTPPQGESLEQAIERLRRGAQKILKRNKGLTIALPIRPLAMQILLGLLRNEQPQEIAAHLHQVSPMEAVDISEEARA